MRTKTNSKSRIEQKMKSRTEPDKDQEKFPNLGPNRTRTEKNQKTLDRSEPGPTKIWKSRTDSDRSVPEPSGPWIPGLNLWGQFGIIKWVLVFGFVFPVHSTIWYVFDPFWRWETFPTMHWVGSLILKI